MSYGYGAEIKFTTVISLLDWLFVQTEKTLMDLLMHGEQIKPSPIFI